MGIALCEIISVLRETDGITQCYLPHSRGDFSALPQPKMVLDLGTPEGCKAELT